MASADFDVQFTADDLPRLDAATGPLPASRPPSREPPPAQGRHHPQRRGDRVPYAGVGPLDVHRDGEGHHGAKARGAGKEAAEAMLDPSSTRSPTLVFYKDAAGSTSAPTRPTPRWWAGTVDKVHGLACHALLRRGRGRRSHGRARLPGIGAAAGASPRNAGSPRPTASASCTTPWSRPVGREGRAAGAGRQPQHQDAPQRGGG